MTNQELSVNKEIVEFYKEREECDKEILEFDKEGFECDKERVEYEHRKS